GSVTGELLRDSLRHAKNISGVLVVIFHQRLLPEGSAFLRITEPVRDLILDVEVEGVGGAAGCVMKIGPKPKKKIVGRFDSPAIRFAQPILPDDMGGGEGALLEECHP